MTTHNKDKIIAAARRADPSITDDSFDNHNEEDWKRIERFYAIAFEAGRVAEREDCILDLHRNADQTLEEIIAAIRARGDSK